MMERKILLPIGIIVFLCTLGLLALLDDAGAAPPGSLIGTSTTNLADSSSFQRKSFYANGLSWVFYSNGTNMVYKSSANGIDWSTENLVRNGCSSGEQFSVWFDGTYIHYAYASSSTAAPVYYRRGIPNGSGTISWGTEQTAVPGASGIAYGLPSISVDTNGFPWIGYRKILGSADTRPMVTKSNKTDGTWGTPTGFPYDLAGWRAAGFVVAPIPLSGGKMVAIYTSTGHYIRARSWNGSSWGGGFTTTNANSNINFSAVAQGDDVHLVWLETSVIRYTIYNFSSNSLSDEGIIQSSVTGSSAPVLSIDSYGDLHLFWAGSPVANHIYYMQNSGGIWDETPLDWIDESASAGQPIKNDSLTGFYNADNGKSLFYLTKNSSPYNLKSSQGSPSIVLTKTGPQEAYIGDTITYQFTVKNTGAVALSNVTVTDYYPGGPPSGIEVCSIGNLGARSSQTCTLNYDITMSDPNPLVNTAIAVGYFGTTEVADSDSHSVRIVNPISVVKEKVGDAFADPGATIQYTIWVTNAWTQNLIITKVEDNKYGLIFEGVKPIGPGQTHTWTHSLQLPSWSDQGPVPPPFVNTVTVYAQSEDGSRRVSNTDAWSMYPIIIRKDIRDANGVDIADDTEFEVWLKDHTAAKILTTFKISESKPKKIWLSEGAYYIKEVLWDPICYRFLPDPYPYENLRYVVKDYHQLYSSEFAQFRFQTGSSRVEWTYLNEKICKICIDKSGPLEACEGENIEYTIKVINCGKTPSRGPSPVLDNVTVIDPLIVLNQNIGSLAVGASSEFTFTYTIKQSEPGSLVNTATASGQYGNTTMTASDTHTVVVESCDPPSNDSGTIIIRKETDPSCMRAPDGMVSWWPGDGDADDMEGGNHGALQGNATFATGMVEKAFSFDGNGDYVSIPFNTGYDFAPADSFTIDAWLNPGRIATPGTPGAPNGYQALVVKSPQSGEWDWGLYLAPDGKFMSGRYNQHVLFSDTATRVGNWYHVAVTYEGNTGSLKLYVNGILEKEISGFLISQSTGGLAIGQRGEDIVYKDYYQGLIDEVEIFDRALSAEEILAIYNAGSAGKCKVGFEFSAEGMDPGSFSLENGESQTFINIAPGMYSITEIVPEGWQLTDITCTDPDGGTTTGEDAAFIDLDAGETVTCTFKNTKLFQQRDFCTYSQGGWGSKPSGKNPGSLLANNFSKVYPSNYVEVGIPGTSGNSMIFRQTSTISVATSTAFHYIERYLPAAGKPKRLTRDYINPSVTTSGVFGGQVLALKLNVDFNVAGITQGPGGPLGNLKLYNTGTSLDGKTVAEILSIANTALGGGSLTAGFTYSALNNLIDNLNKAFDDCLPSTWAQEHLRR